MTVTRINFLERQTFVPTYRKMAVAAAGIVALCLLAEGFQAARLFFLNRKVAHLTAEISELRSQRQKVLLSVTQSGEAGLGIAQRSLKLRFEKGPVWSAVLKTLGEEMPSSVWLASLKTYEKPESPSGRGMILIGETTSAAEVSSFLKALGESRPFMNVVLSSSQEEKGAGGVSRYHFTIDAWVKPGGTS